MAFQAKRLGSVEAKRQEDTTYQDWVVQLPGLKTQTLRTPAESQRLNWGA